MRNLLKWFKVFFNLYRFAPALREYGAKTVAGAAPIQYLYRPTQPVLCSCGCRYRTDDMTCPKCHKDTVTVMRTVTGNVEPCGSMVARK